MTIRLDHTIVPAEDKIASAEFFAHIFGLSVKVGHFAQVQINESLTFDFGDERGPDGEPNPNAAKVQIQHYAFHVSDKEFDEIFERVKAKGLSYGSGPFNRANNQLYHLRGGRGFYFEDPNGHLLEVMTVPETGS